MSVVTLPKQRMELADAEVSVPGIRHYLIVPLQERRVLPDILLDPPGIAVAVGSSLDDEEAGQ
jgi:hypothetical protein